MPKSPEQIAEEAKNDRYAAITTLSIAGITLLLCLMMAFGVGGLFIWSIVAWLAYWAIGIPATKLCMWLWEVIADEPLEATQLVKSLVYVFWPLVLPIMTVIAIVVSMFRVALRLIG